MWRTTATHVAKFTAGGKLIKRWSVPAAKSIAVGAGRVYVLTALFNAVGEYSYTGANLTGFVASFPDQWWRFAGYEPPSIRIAEEIGTDNSGNPIVVGESDQPLSSAEPDCHSVIDIHHELDHHPYPDPLRSGEAVRFTPAGAPVDTASRTTGTRTAPTAGAATATPSGGRGRPERGRRLRPGRCRDEIDHLGPNLVDPDNSGGLPGTHALFSPCYICGKQFGDAPIVVVPLGDAFDCRSNLYVAFASGFLVKYLNLQPPASPKCHKQLPIEALESPLHVLGGLDATGGNKGAEVKLGCTLRVCAGTLHFEIPRCTPCTAAPPLRFKCSPGRNEPSP